MGQCGCGDFAGEFTLPAPDGGLYVFWRYHPCAECETPAGMIISHLGPGDLEMWNAQEIPTLELARHGGERLIPVVSPDALIEAVRELEAKSVLVAPDAYRTMTEAIADLAVDLLTKTICKTEKTW